MLLNVDEEREREGERREKQMVGRIYVVVKKSYLLIGHQNWNRMLHPEHSSGRGGDPAPY